MTARLSRDDSEKLRAELNQRIEAARTSLEHPQPEDWANIYRGEIRACRALLEWLDPAEANKRPEPLPARMRISEPPNY